VLEIAGSLALLVGCGLMVRTAINLLTTDLGVRTEGIVRARLALTTERYSDPAALAAFHKRLMAQLPDQVGTSSALSDYPPLFQAALRPIQSDTGESPPVAAHVMTVSPEYFGVMGIGMVHGRSFSDQDAIGGELAAVVSETVARRLDPRGSVIGHQIRIVQPSAAGGRPGPSRTVIGVVRDVRQNLQDSEPADVYLPQYQEPSPFAQIVMRADRQRSGLRERIAESAGTIDRDALISAVTPLDQDVEQLVQRPQLLASMLTGFAGFSLVLALLGLYGVTAYTTEHRARELALRAALGATRHELTRMILRGGVVTIGAGVALGLLGASALSGALREQLHGVQPFDAGTVAIAATVVAACGLIAVWRPAYATASQNPAAVLNRDS
jgi:ABC-type antimicrobial peptide transport system permease subunit